MIGGRVRKRWNGMAEKMMRGSVEGRKGKGKRKRRMIDKEG